MADPAEPRPTPSVLRWVERAAGPGATVLGCRRLPGGLSSSVHAVTVETSTGQRHALVLRRWIDGEADWTRAAVERERVALVGLADSAVPAPRFVAASLGADTDGHPSLLMTRVRGRVNLEPKEPGDWLGQMAAALPPIHALGIDAPPAQLWRRVSDPRVPAWSTRPWLWREARELLAGRLLRAARSFTPTSSTSICCGGASA